MEEIEIYKEGLFNLIFLLLREEDKISLTQEPALVKLFESEGMDKVFIEGSWAILKNRNEPEIFNRTVELIKKCNEEKKIRAFTCLFNLAKCCNKIQKREIQLLQYTCQLTINELMKVKLSVDEQTPERHGAKNHVFLVGGYEIDHFITEKFLTAYIDNLSIHSFSGVNKFSQVFLANEQTPIFFILIVDPIRFDISNHFEKVYDLPYDVSIYILTSSMYLLSRTINLTNFTRVKGILEMPITESDIKRIALENNLPLKEEILSASEGEERL